MSTQEEIAEQRLDAAIVSLMADYQNLQSEFRQRADSSELDTSDTSVLHSKHAEWVRETNPKKKFMAGAMFCILLAEDPAMKSYLEERFPEKHQVKFPYRGGSLPAADSALKKHVSNLGTDPQSKKSTTSDKVVIGSGVLLGIMAIVGLVLAFTPLFPIGLALIGVAGIGAIALKFGSDMNEAGKRIDAKEAATKAASERDTEGVPGVPNADRSVVSTAQKYGQLNSATPQQQAPAPVAPAPPAPVAPAPQQKILADSPRPRF